MEEIFRSMIAYLLLGNIFTPHCLSSSLPLSVSPLLVHSGRARNVTVTLIPLAES